MARTHGSSGFAPSLEFRPAPAASALTRASRSPDPRAACLPDPRAACLPAVVLRVLLHPLDLLARRERSKVCRLLLLQLGRHELEAVRARHLSVEGRAASSAAADRRGTTAAHPALGVRTCRGRRHDRRFGSARSLAARSPTCERARARERALTELRSPHTARTNDE